jgi:hypothetical protein
MLAAAPGASTVAKLPPEAAEVEAVSQAPMYLKWVSFCWKVAAGGAWVTVPSTRTASTLIPYPLDPVLLLPAHSSDTVWSPEPSIPVLYTFC